MAEEYFAKFEINFILTDLRLRKLTPTQRWIYVCLWTYAVQERLETVWMPDGNVSIASVCHVDGRSIPSALTKMQQLCLIKWDGKEWLTVCGVKNKHKKLRWKDSSQNEFDGGQGDTPEAGDIDIDKEEDVEVDDTRTPSIQNPEVEEIYQKIVMSDLNPLLKPEGRKWVAGLIDYFGLEKVQAGFDSMIKSMLDGKYTISNRESARKWIGREKEKGGSSDEAERLFLEGT